MTPHRQLLGRKKKQPYLVKKIQVFKETAHFHSLRVQFTVMLWKRLTHQDVEFEPEQWGWKLDGTQLSLIMTDMEAGPEALLKFVRCKCKLSSRNPCGTNTCCCHENGLKHVTACGD